MSSIWLAMTRVFWGGAAFSAGMKKYIARKTNTKNQNRDRLILALPVARAHCPAPQPLPPFC